MSHPAGTLWSFITLWMLCAGAQTCTAQATQTKADIRPLDLVGRYLDTQRVGNIPAIILEVKSNGTYSAEFPLQTPAPVSQQGNWIWEEKWQMLRLNQTNSTGRLRTYDGEPWVFGSVQVEQGSTNELHYGNVVLKREPR